MLLILSAALLHTRWFSLARIFLTFQAIFIVFICFIPLGTLGLHGLENRIPNKTFSEIDGINGVIVLGGAENPQLTMDTGKINLNHNSERLIYAGFFAKKKVKVLFLGGSGSINQELLKETSVVKKYFEKIGKKNYILYDNRPRNTYEAAKYATEYKMLKQGKWVLITSAFHMPRAIASFDKYELDLIPFSVDHRTYKRALLSNPVEELNYLSIVIHEYIGILYYFLKGRI